MKFGLALGGGGLRGAFHIGFLEVLLENGIKPDVIAGTSAGAIVAGVYASGVSPKKMQALFSEQQSLIQSTLEKRLSLIPSGLIKGSTLEFILKGITKNKGFASLNPPTAIVATDIHNGQPVIFTSPQLAARSKQKNCTFITKSPVSEAIRASISIPGIFQPIKVKGYTLVDGGLVSNVPADVLKLMGVKKILAVNLGFSVIKEKELDSAIGILLQAADIMGERISQQILDRYADLVIHPNTGEVSLWEIHKIPSLLELGRETARQNLQKVKKLLA